MDTTMKKLPPKPVDTGPIPTTATKIAPKSRSGIVLTIFIIILRIPVTALFLTIFQMSETSQAVFDDIYNGGNGKKGEEDA